MLVRIFTLKFDPVLGDFDGHNLRDFIKDKEVLSIRDHSPGHRNAALGVRRLNIGSLPEAGQTGNPAAVGRLASVRRWLWDRKNTGTRCLI